MEFSGHADKVQIVKWHPLAQDVLLTVAFDRTIKVWDLNKTDAPKVELEVSARKALGTFLFETGISFYRICSS